MSSNAIYRRRMFALINRSNANATRDSYDWDNIIQIVIMVPSTVPVERRYITEAIKLVDSNIQDKNILFVDNYTNLGLATKILSSPCVVIAPYYVGGAQGIPNWRTDKFNSHLFINGAQPNATDRIVQENPPGTLIVGAGLQGITRPDMNNPYTEFVDLTDRDIYPVTNVTQDGIYAKVLSSIMEVIYFSSNNDYFYLSGISGFANNISGWHQVTKVYDWPVFALGFTHNLGAGSFVGTNANMRAAWLSGSIATVGAKINMIRKQMGCSLEEARLRARVSAGEVWTKERGFGWINTANAMYAGETDASGLFLPILSGQTSSSKVTNTQNGLYMKYLFGKTVISTEILPYATSIKDEINNIQEPVAVYGLTQNVGRYYQTEVVENSPQSYQFRQYDVYGNSSLGNVINITTDNFLTIINAARAAISDFYKIGIGTDTTGNTALIDCSEIASIDYFGELYIEMSDNATYAIKDVNDSRVTEMDEEYFVNLRWTNDLATYKAEKVPAPVECDVPGDYASIPLAVAAGKTFINVVSGTHTLQYNLPDNVDLNISDGAIITGSGLYTLQVSGVNRIFGRGIIENTSNTTGASVVHAQPGATLVVEGAELKSPNRGILFNDGANVILKTPLITATTNSQEVFTLYPGSKLIIDAFVIDAPNAPYLFKEFGSEDVKVYLKNSRINYSGLLFQAQSSSLHIAEMCILNCTSVSEGAIAFIRGTYPTGENSIRMFYVDGVNVRFYLGGGLSTLKSYADNYTAMMAAREIFKENWKKYISIPDVNGVLYYINLANITRYSVNGDTITFDETSIVCESGWAAKHFEYLDECYKNYHFLSTFTGEFLHVGVGREYNTIASAVAAAVPGQAVWVHDGPYDEAVKIKDGIIVYYDEDVLHRGGGPIPFQNIHTVFWNHQSNGTPNFKVYGYGNFHYADYLWWDSTDGTDGWDGSKFFWSFKTQKSDNGRAIFPSRCHTKLICKGYSHGKLNNATHTSFIDTDAQLEGDFDLVLVENVVEGLYQPFKTSNAKLVFRNLKLLNAFTLISFATDYGIGVSDYRICGILIESNSIVDGYGLLASGDCEDKHTFIECIFLKTGATKDLVNAFGGSFYEPVYFRGNNYLANTTAVVDWDGTTVIQATPLVFDDTLLEITDEVEINTVKSKLLAKNSIWHNNDIFGQSADMQFVGTNIVKHDNFPLDIPSKEGIYEINENLTL